MYDVHVFSEAGGHQTNEDAWSAEPHPTDPSCLVCALADGQGGRAGGAEAAAVACRTTLKALHDEAPKQLARPFRWPGLLAAADRAAAEAADAGFTTLVALAIRDGHLCGASNGDSAAVAICGGRTLQLTANQPKNPPVGSGMAGFVPFAVPLEAPWRVLLMSDGVWKYVGWEAITAIAAQHRGPAVIDKLQAAARLPGSGKFQDDFTVVVVEAALR